jgi:hypothetical protein
MTLSRWTIALGTLGLCFACSSSTGSGNTIGVGDLGKGGGNNGGGQGGASFGTGSGFNQGGSGNSSFGQEGGTPVCNAQEVASEALPVDMYIMFDQSSSMQDLIPGTNQTWWQAAEQAVATFVQDPRVAKTNIGINFFPQGGVAPNSCNFPYQTPTVELGPAPQTAPKIIQAMQQFGNGAFTPTIPALTGAVAHMQQWAQDPAHAGRAPVVVLVTDGFPTECPAGAQITDVANVAAQAYAGTPRILTFVVGFNQGNENLKQIAKAGGTGTAFLIEGGDVSTQFVNAMLSVTDTPLSCTFSVPTSTDPNNPIDFDLVRVRYFPAATNQPIEVPRVQNLGDCQYTLNHVGWFYDTPPSATSNPTQINICPGTCSGFNAGHVSIEYGCKPITPNTM